MEKVNPITSNNYSVIEDFVKAINEKYFDGKMHFRIVPSDKKKKNWTRNRTKVYTDPINGFTFYPIEVLDISNYRNKNELVICIVTQMILAYCEHNGIKAVSNNDMYKNKFFKEIGEHMGLVFSSERDTYGQIPIGVSQTISSMINDKDLKKLRIYVDNSQIKSVRKTSSTFKVQCPICGTSGRFTKKSVKDICGNCYEKTGKIVYRKIVS